MIVTSLQHDGVLRIELGRPAKRNALGIASYEALATHFADAQTDERVRAILLSGRGDVFCAGNDLTEFTTAWPQPPGGPVERFLTAILLCDKPIVAAVQGGAIGIGATMLAHCDLVFAGRGAYLRYPFVDLGITAEGGSSWLLPACIGQVRAANILLTGRKVPAEEAFTLGLVSAVVGDDELQVQAACAAGEIAAKSPDAVRATKRLMRAEMREAVLRRIPSEISAINELLGLRKVR